MSPKLVIDSLMSIIHDDYPLTFVQKEALLKSVELFKGIDYLNGSTKPDTPILLTDVWRP